MHFFGDSSLELKFVKEQVKKLSSLQYTRQLLAIHFFHQLVYTTRCLIVERGKNKSTHSLHHGSRHAKHRKGYRTRVL